MRFNLIDIFKRRAYEISACCGEKLSVRFNNEDVPIRRFKDFCCMYFEDENDICYENSNERWK